MTLHVPPWRDSWVLWRDDDLWAVDKPAGVPCQPDEAGTDVRARLGAFDPALAGGLRMPRLLDREASGVMLLARTKEASRELAGKLEPLPGRWLVGLTGPPATTHRVVARRGDRRLVEVAHRPHLRRVLCAAGTPVAGDRDNGGAPAARLMLHLATLAIERPGGGKLELSAPTPAAMTRWLEGAAADLEALLVEALDRRYGIDADAFRLVHGAGDGLEGVEIDIYRSHAVCALREREQRASAAELGDALVRLGARGVYLVRRPRKASDLDDTRREELAPAGPIAGEAAPSPLPIREGGVEYLAHLGHGLSTGIFLDQRRARELVRARAGGARVLNLFGYHGAFTVAAVAGGARRTVTVDVSGAALERAAESLARAGAEPPAHERVRADVLVWLGELARDRGGERFDLVILDPPSFSTTKRSTFRADKQYRRVAADAIACLAPGGTLYASTNHRGIARHAFRRVLERAAGDAGRQVRAMTDLPAQSDFPAPPGGECHLKAVLLEVE